MRKFFNFKNLSVLFSLSVALVALPAFADTAGDAADNLFGQFSNFAKVLTAGSFLAGLGLGAISAFKFKAHADNPQQVTLKIPLIYALVAAILIGLPAWLNMSRNTLFTESGASNSLDGEIYSEIK